MCGVESSIRSVCPKDQVKDIIVWSREGLLKYANKEKASTFMAQLQSQFPQTWSKNIEAYMDNIIKNLEDGKGKSENKEKTLTTCTLSRQLRAEQIAKGGC